jgi:hypothetical protein
MRNLLVIAAIAAATLASPAAAAATVTYDSTPTGGFHYGAGNDYAPANATVSVAHH